ncbi:DNA-binding SARP family transcriptional activator/tetratricopeptide (TPR) repeat protein [Saccharothrix tamanrassetensis]|uniref:DNA-binding SARP family transcriptional activator/tetratricopeptide (TPR) repeat protein n=1 Tax=Saccharothrix tamanrassetensis TaxID=1051531 RepID=A0A841CXK4_9PSEU|nr:BTAD domain-containing putative transcriptional regulator [Saccharothrix tamanrassetensis]MBB5960717.1 DNA-binding SARP family transcriptional activator/tetratricopeptide (TPR) repeat protein [Saccharothrix tamanrassetensis]
MVEFRLLGQVVVERDGHQVDVGPARQQCVLAVLLVEANTAVPAEVLIDRVWEDRPPLRVRSSLHSYLTRLRRALAAAPVSITWRSGSYVLTVDEQAVDLHRFRRLIGQARTAVDDEQAMALIRQALELWRGEAFAGLDTPWLHTVRAVVEQERLGAMLDLTDRRLRLGQHAAVLPALRAQAEQHPVNERLVGQFMLALYRDGRQADALQVFRDTRHTLASELGIEPGPDLRRLHERILRADPDLAAPTMPRPIRRNDLPGDVADFTGRRAELDRLRSMLPRDADTGPGTAAVIAAIDGMAGVGKTTLAIHLAHHVARRYPDAQLYIDLRAHTAGHEPVEPVAALNTLLRALDVSGEKIPEELETRAALWRAELAGRKVLIVLDNAASATQVRPLLPGTAGCLTLVTSRRRLVDLETAHTLSLDVLPRADAVNLVRGVFGDDRAADTDAVQVLVELCGYLPLALRIAAARLRTRPTWTVADLVTRLRDGRTRLTAGDRSVAAAFGLSYQQLSAPRQRLFRRLGLVPGPDFDRYAASALNQTDPVATGELLEELVDVHLLQQPAPGRYRFHDLLRHHAADLAAHTDTPADEQTALANLVDHYLHTAYAADRLIRPHRTPIEIGQPPFDCHPQPLPDAAAAWAWFTAEYPNLLASQQLAVERKWHDAVWQLAWVLHTFHHRQGHIHDHVVAWRAAMAAADRLSEPAVLIMTHRLLGNAHSLAARHDEAIQHLARSLRLAEDAGDIHGQAHAHGALSQVWGGQGDHLRALESATHAMRLFRAIDLPVWEAEAQSAVGWHRAQLGHYAQARIDCEHALVLRRRHHDRSGEALTMDNLGYIAHHTGQHTDALDYYQQALLVYRESGNTYEEASALDRLGHTHLALNQHEQATQAWRQAAELFHAQGRTTDADRIQRQLTEIWQSRHHPPNPHERKPRV